MYYNKTLIFIVQKVLEQFPQMQVLIAGAINVSVSARAAFILFYFYFLMREMSLLSSGFHNSVRSHCTF